MKSWLLCWKFVQNKQRLSLTHHVFALPGLPKAWHPLGKRSWGFEALDKKKGTEAHFSSVWVCRAQSSGSVQEMVLPPATLMMEITVAAQLGACCMLEVCSESIRRARFFRGFKHEKMKKFYFESPADLFPTLVGHNREKRNDLSACILRQSNSM